LAGRSIVLGRGGDGIRLEDDAVSTRHATIAQSNDGRLLYIDESRNGSVVDSKPVHRAQAEIKDGSTIQIGVSKLKVAVVMPAAQRGGAASAAAPTVAVPVGSRPTEMFTGYELKVLNGQSAGKTFPLTQQTVTIGREEDRTIVLTDSTLSRKHATLTLEGGQFVLANESSQGTTVNGKRVERHTLQSGDEIQTGEVKMQFHKAV
jgi:pSer/pThr/pTyr-binding forkhead associated (FHA) protein